MNKLKKIKAYFQREWIDFLIFGISAVAIISATIMVIQIREINAELEEISNEIVELQDEQARIDILTDEHAERINRILAEYEAEKTSYLYDIPLSEDLQKYTYELCRAYEVDYETVLAIMQIESYYTNVVSAGGDYGLCQINKVNHEWLYENYGLDDMLDEHQNIKACVVMLNDIQQNEYFDTPEKVLMAYNMGQGGAKKAIENGVTETNYTKKVYNAIETLEYK